MPTGGSRAGRRGRRMWKLKAARRETATGTEGTSSLRIYQQKMQMRRRMYRRIEWMKTKSKF